MEDRVCIRIHFKNGSVAEVHRPHITDAYRYVRENISYSGGRVIAVYIHEKPFDARCVHNNNWTYLSNAIAKQTPL